MGFSVPAIIWSKEGHIDQYGPSRLFAYGHLIHLKGSVLNTRHVLLSLALYMTLATVYGLGICDATQTAPNGDVCGTTDASAAFCKSAYGNVCFYATTIKTGLLLTGIVSIAMGVFMTQTLARWLSICTLLQQVHGRTNDFIVKATVYIEGADAAAEALKRDLARYAMLGQGLLFKQACREDDYGELVDLGLLTPDERVVLHQVATSDHFLLAYLWASKLLVRAATAGRLALPCNVMPMMQDDISAMRSAASDVFMVLGTPLPYAYAHILTVLLKFYLFLTVIVSGSVLGGGIAAGSNAAIAWGYTIMGLNAVLFEGLLVTHSYLVRPFGSSPLSRPFSLYTHAMLGANIAACKALVAASLSGGGRLPAPVTEGAGLRTGVPVACRDPHTKNFSLLLPYLAPPPPPSPLPDSGRLGRPPPTLSRSDSTTAMRVALLRGPSFTGGEGATSPKAVLGESGTEGEGVGSGAAAAVAASAAAAAAAAAAGRVGRDEAGGEESTTGAPGGGTARGRRRVSLSLAVSPPFETLTQPAVPPSPGSDGLVARRRSILKGGSAAGGGWGLGDSGRDAASADGDSTPGSASSAAY